MKKIWYTTFCFFGGLIQASGKPVDLKLKPVRQGMVLGRNIPQAPLVDTRGKSSAYQHRKELGYSWRESDGSSFVSGPLGLTREKGKMRDLSKKRKINR